MNITLNAEDIDKFVKEALIKSAIGETIQKALSELLNDSYRSPLRDAIKRHVSNVAYEVIKERHTESIRAQIIDVLDKQLTKDLSDKVVEASVNKMIKAIEENY